MLSSPSVLQLHLAAAVTLQSRQAAGGLAVAFCSQASSLHIPPVPHSLPEYAVSAATIARTLLAEYSILGLQTHFSARRLVLFREELQDFSGPIVLVVVVLQGARPCSISYRLITSAESCSSPLELVQEVICIVSSRRGGQQQAWALRPADASL